MKRLVFGLLTLVFLVGHAVAAEPTFPPLGTRYDNLSDATATVLDAVRRVEAMTDIGVNFLDYDRAVSAAYVEVKVFVESRRAESLPELRTVLTNAVECYLKIRDLWGTKISSGSISAKYEAGVTLITAQPMLWKVAAANIAAARTLVESPRADKEIVRESLLQDGDLLTLEGGLHKAEQKLVQLGRESRARASGFEVPSPSPAYVERDLAQIAFSPDDFGGSLAAGEFSERLPRIYEEVPPAVQEGHLRFLIGDEQQGGVTIFLYENPAAASAAFKQIKKGFGKEGKVEQGLGDEMAIVGTAGRSCSLVMRRGTAVVSMLEPTGSAQRTREAASRIETRLSAFMPLDDPTARQQEGIPNADLGPYDWESLLLQKGDLAEEIQTSGMEESLPRIFSNVPLCDEQGTLELEQNGQAAGFIVFLRYADEEGAKAAFQVIMSDGGRTGSRISGVGNEGYASRQPMRSKHAMAFRRGEVVIYSLVPVKSRTDLLKFGRAVDRRLRDAQKSP